MNRRQLLAGIIPLSITAALPAGAIIASRPRQRSFPLGHGRCGSDTRRPRCGYGDFETANDYRRFVRDQQAAVCPVCDVPHVRFRDDTVHGRACYTPDLIARIEQLQEEVGKAGDAIQQLGHDNDGLHDKMLSKEDR